MAPKHLMIAVNWYGPYNSVEDACKAAKDDYYDGLYICIGRKSCQRVESIQYIGLSKSLHARLKDTHHKLSEILPSTRKIWLGEIATAEPSGKRLRVTKATLDFSEWLHARFLKLPLNDKKTKGLPSRSVTVLNRWWKTDYQTARRNRPHQNWPDLIDYQGDELPTRLVWFGRRQKVIAHPYDV